MRSRDVEPPIVEPPMSPLALRRYRADRLLRDQFHALRGNVLATVRRRLAASGVAIAEVDLEACYAQAWHGLYTTILGGENVESPTAWLVTVCFRRALDEHRASSVPGRRLFGARDVGGEARGGDGDLVDTLDDRTRIVQLLEGVCATMSAREREAATLCLLHGMSRSEAARTMGIAPRRLERLMDGRGAGRPGVSAKLSELAGTIAAGAFCEQRASSMRALAFGVLDPEGERYRLAVAHQRSCPACRAYVQRLRGLAVVLPPILLPGVLGAGAHEASGLGRPSPRGRAGGRGRAGARRRAGGRRRANNRLPAGARRGIRMRLRARPQSLLARVRRTAPRMQSGGGLSASGGVLASKLLAFAAAGVLTAGAALAVVAVGRPAGHASPNPGPKAVALARAHAAAPPRQRTTPHHASPHSAGAMRAGNEASRRAGGSVGVRQSGFERSGFERLAGGLLVPSPDGLLPAREFGFERRAPTKPARSGRRTAGAASAGANASPSVSAGGSAANASGTRPVTRPVEPSLSASRIPTTSPPVEPSFGASGKPAASAIEPNVSASARKGARLGSEFGFEGG